MREKIEGRRNWFNYTPSLLGCRLNSGLSQRGSDIFLNSKRTQKMRGWKEFHLKALKFFPKRPDGNPVFWFFFYLFIFDGCNSCLKYFYWNFTNRLGAEDESLTWILLELAFWCQFFRFLMEWGGKSVAATFSKDRIITQEQHLW